MVPFILKQTEHRKAIAQKLKEAQLVRQQKVIEAQFLDAISDLLWKWRYLSIKVTYYGSEEASERYTDAKTEYDKEIWTLFHAVRTQISKSRRLVSNSAYDDLLQFYELMVTLDKDLRRIGLNEPVERPLQYTKINARIYGEVSSQVDQQLDALARQLKLDKMSAIISGE